MRAPQPLPEGAAERLAALLKDAKSKAEYQRIQCVWLRAALGLRAAQIATALGWQVGSVRQVHSDYLRQGEAVLQDKPSGGRHRQNLTVEQEKELLLPFLEQAEAPGAYWSWLPCKRPMKPPWAVRSTTRSSTVRCIARGGARSCRGPVIRKGTKPCARRSKKLTGDDPRTSSAVRRVWSTRAIDV
jgi:transposase